MGGLEKFMSRLGFGKAETEEIRNVVSNQEEVSSGIGSENVDKKGTDLGC